MISTGKIIIILMILAGLFTSFSGCLSPQNENSSGSIHTTRQSPSSSSSITSEKYWIRIDPIRDYQTDSMFNITGSTLLFVNGTTNFPVGTPLRLGILEDNRTRDLIRTEITIKSSNSGPNTFSFDYDMKGNPPGVYMVVLTNSTNPPSAFSSFAITTGTPYLKWIRMDPLGKVQQYGILPVSGTTDLPAGSEISIRASVVFHSCTMTTPDRFGERSVCGGSCRDPGPLHIISVIEGSGGINTWNSTVDTSNWCPGEEYGIGAHAVNWTNVTSAGQSYRF